MNSHAPAGVKGIPELGLCTAVGFHSEGRFGGRPMNRVLRFLPNRMRRSLTVSSFVLTQALHGQPSAPTDSHRVIGSTSRMLLDHMIYIGTRSREFQIK